jgi:acyl carrier protein
MQDVKNVVRRFLRDNFVMGGQTEIADDSSFMERHILDSTGFMELISFVEESFGIKVEDEEMLPANLDSLVNIERYLARKGAPGLRGVRTSDGEREP